MSNITNNINVQLIEILSQLSHTEQKKVLDFAISLRYQKKFKEWDSISDEEAASLKAEFAQEDINFAEAVLSDCLHQIDSEE
jgi:hypothetical protein